MPEETVRLADAVERMTQVLERLDSSVDVAAEVREKQLKQGRFMKVATVVIGVLVFIGVISVALLGFAVGKSDDRAQCNSINAVNTQLTGFLRTYVSRTSQVPPGPDATQSEVDRYNAAIRNRDEFLRLLDESFAPVKCD